MNDPGELATAIAALDRPLLITFDCDGVLAPLTDHADDSVLTAGVGDDLARLATCPDTIVAILSGRSLDGLSQFDFDDAIHVSGSYGAEQRGGAPAALTREESNRLRVLDELLNAAARRAGDGAWIERKPTSVVVHVREADPRRGRAALDWAFHEQLELRGHVCHRGDNVLELMTRSADKGTGLDALRREFEPAATVYVGDDVPDEDAFARLGDGDIGIKVGQSPSIATRRITDPDHVRTMIAELVEAIAP